MILSLSILSVCVFMLALLFGSSEELGWRLWFAFSTWLSFSFGVTIIYVAYHFISKYW